MERPQLELTPNHVMFGGLFFMVMMITIAIPALFAAIYAGVYGLGIGLAVTCAALFALTGSLFVLTTLYFFTGE